MKTILRNYKTTVPAILAVVAVTLYWTGYIDQQQLTVGMSVLTAVGLLGAKDHDAK